MLPLWFNPTLGMAYIQKAQDNYDTKEQKACVQCLADSGQELTR